MESFQMGNIAGGQNLMKNVFSAYNQNLKNMQGSDDLQLGMPLQGQIEVNMPKDLNSLSDKELVSDLKQILDNTSNTASMNNAQGVSGVATPDKLVNTFSQILENGINDLDKTQKAADHAVETFASGGDIDVHTVMIASEKASLNMQLAMKLRNSVVRAYTEIKQIRV